MSKASIVLSLLTSAVVSCFGQSNPGLYFRVTQCNNIKSAVFVNDKQIFNGACNERLSWVPVMFNHALGAGKNKLRLELKNEKEGDYYGALTFELLSVNNDETLIKKFYSSEVKLQDFDRFQMNIDNLIRKQGWSVDNNGDVAVRSPAIDDRNRKDSLDFLFNKRDRFYVVITAAKRANYSVDLNGHHILGGNLHISGLDEAYALKSYPFFFLNAFDKNEGKAVLTYNLAPQEGKQESFLEIAIQYYAPYAIDPQIIAISKITCGKDEVRSGEFDITEPLRRHGYFNIK